MLNNKKNAERVEQHKNDLVTGKPKGCCYRCSKPFAKKDIKDRDGHVVQTVPDSHTITFYGIANTQMKTEVCPACFLSEFAGAQPTQAQSTQIVALPTHKDKKHGGRQGKGAPMLVKTSEPQVPLLTTFALLGSIHEAQQAYPEMEVGDAIRAYTSKHKLADERAS